MENKKKCAVCGAEFEAYNKNHKYCCAWCQKESVKLRQKTDEHKAYMREKMKERRWRLKSACCCEVCGKQDAKTLAGKVRCAECAAKASFATARYKERKSRKEVS